MAILGNMSVVYLRENYKNDIIDDKLSCKEKITQILTVSILLYDCTIERNTSSSG